MKFKYYFILILILCLALCGCKQEQIEATVPTTVVTEPPTEPPLPKAGLLLKNFNADDQDGIKLQTTIEGMGYEVLLRDAENDQTKQNEQATALIDAGCEVLVLQPVMVSGLDVLLKDIAVPVIILDAQPKIPENMNNVTVLCAREENAGSVEATLLASLPKGGDINGDGTVAMILVQGPEDHLDSAARATAFTAGLNTETQIVLETVSGDWSEDGGKSACRTLLSKYGPDVEVIVSFGEEMALGVIAAVENGGWIPGQDVYVLAVGSSSAVRNELRLGRISGLAAPDAEVRLQLLKQLISGESTEKVNYVDYIAMNP